MQYNILNPVVQIDDILNQYYEDKQQLQSIDYISKEKISIIEKINQSESVKTKITKNSSIQNAIQYGQKAKLFIIEMPEQINVNNRKKLVTRAETINEARKRNYEQLNNNSQFKDKDFIKIRFNNNKYLHMCNLILSTFADQQIPYKGGVWQDYRDKYGRIRTWRAVNMAKNYLYASKPKSVLQGRYKTSKRALLKPPKFIKRNGEINYFKVRSQSKQRNEHNNINIYTVLINFHNIYSSYCNCDDQKVNNAYLKLEKLNNLYKTTKRKVRIRLNTGEIITKTLHYNKNIPKTAYYCKHIRLCLLYIKLNINSFNNISTNKTAIAKELSFLFKTNVNEKGIPLVVASNNKNTPVSPWMKNFFDFPSSINALYNGKLINPTKFFTMYQYVERFGITYNQFMIYIQNWAGYNKLQQGYQLFVRLNYLIRRMTTVLKTNNRYEISTYKTYESFFDESFQYLIPNIETPTIDFIKKQRLVFEAQVVTFNSKFNIFKCTCADNQIEQNLCVHMIAFYFYVNTKNQLLAKSILAFIKIKYQKKDPIKQSPFEIKILQSRQSLKQFYNKQKYEQWKITQLHLEKYNYNQDWLKSEYNYKAVYNNNKITIY